MANNPNTFSVLPEHNTSRVSLRGNMMVSFSNVLPDGFSIRFFTTTNEIFTIEATNYVMVDLSGTHSTNFAFGGEPGLFVEFGLAGADGLLYITASNVTGGLEPRVDALEANTSDLPTIRTQVGTVASAIADLPNIRTGVTALQNANTTTQTAIADLPGIKNDITNLQTSSNGIQNAISDLPTIRTNVLHAQSDITGLQQITNTVQTAISDLPAIRSNVSGLLTSNSTIQTSLAAIPGIQSNITTLQGNVTDLQTNAAATQAANQAAIADLPTIRTDLSTIKGNISDVLGSTSTMQAQIAGLQSDDADVKAAIADLATIRSDISALKTDDTNVKAAIADLSDIRTEISALQNDDVNIKGAISDLATIRTEIAALQSNDTDVGTAIADLPTIRSHISDLQTATADLPMVHTNITNLQTATVDLPTVRTNISDLQTATADLPTVHTNITNLQTATADLPTIRTNITANSTKLRKFVYVSDYGAVGDGVTDDSAAIMAADQALAPGGTLIFDNNKVYSTNAQVVWKNAGEINGNNGTIKPTKNVIATASSCVYWSNLVTTYAGTGFPFSITQNTRTITLPANATANVGDLLHIRGRNTSNGNYLPSDVYVASPQDTSDGVTVQRNTSLDYFHGFYTTVLAVSGNTISISTPAYQTFQVYSIYRYAPPASMRIRNLNLDLTNSDATCLGYNEGLSIVGGRIEVTGCRFFGGKYGLCGVAVYGETAKVSGNLMRGFLDVQGQGVGISGGRIGYGMLSNANSMLCESNVFAECKHGYSSGSHFVVSNNATIRNNLIYEDTSLDYSAELGTILLYAGGIDFHCGITGKVWIHNNYVVAAKSVFSMRNGKGGVAAYKNTFIIADAINGGTLFSGTEVPFDSLIIDDNDIFFPAGTLSTVLGINGTYGVSDWINSYTDTRISNNRIVGYDAGNGFNMGASLTAPFGITNTSITPGGYVLSVGRDTMRLYNIVIEGNQCKNLKGLVNLTGGATGAGCTMEVKNLQILKNVMKGCEQMFYCNLETATSNQLTDITIKGNRFLDAALNANFSTQHPIYITGPNLSARTTVITNLNIEDNLIDLSSDAVKSSNGYCLNLALSITTGHIRNNRFYRDARSFGRTLGTGNARNVVIQTATYTDLKFVDNYMDTDMTITSGTIGVYTLLYSFVMGNNTTRSVTFTEGSSDLRFQNVRIHDNNMSVFKYQPRSTTTAWSTVSQSTDVLVEGNTVFSVQGFAVDINQYATGHRFHFYNNSITRGFSDLSGTYYGKPAGNYSAVSTNSVNVPVTAVTAGATTTFTVLNLNRPALNGSPFLRAGDVVTMSNLLGNSAALFNGIQLVVASVTDAATDGGNGTFVISVTSTDLQVQTSGNVSAYTRAPYIWWKGNTVAGDDGMLYTGSVPTTGTWNKSDKVWFFDPAATGYAYAECITGGTPGTWALLGQVNAPSTVPTATTWAAKPASPAVGTLIKLTDYNNRLMRWDGSFWILEGTRPWAQSGTQSTVTGTTTETILATIKIPAGMLGANGVIRTTMLGSFGASGSGTLSALKLRFGGNTVATSTKLYLSDNGSSASTVSVNWSVQVRNNTTASQTGTPDNGVATSALNTATIDTTVDQYLTITGVLTTASDSITMSAYTVELFPG